MYNRVILAEKPDMGDSIARALGYKTKKRGYIELTNGDVVTWAIGHLIHLITPDQYPEYKSWSIDALPVIPSEMRTEVDAKKVDQYNIVKKLLFESKTCILATDPDREGEYIGRLILNQCGYNREFQRLWIDDLTEATIQKGMQNLQSCRQFDTLAAAAQTRSYADYWLGFTASRLYTILAREHMPGQKTTLAAGRVQTPTLRLVYDREMAITDFKPNEFYQLIATLQVQEGTYRGLWFQDTTEGTINRFEDKQQLMQLQQKIKGKTGTVKNYVRKEVKRSAPQLFNSSALKTAARKKLGFSTVKTTEVLQQLYDTGYVSYPRADSRHLSENKAAELVSHLERLRGHSPVDNLFPAALTSLSGKKRFVDDKKAATHHAIVPTGKRPATDWSEQQKGLYTLILQQTLAAHHPEGLDEEIEIITMIEGETFISRSVSVLELGWRRVLQEEEEGSEQHPSVKLPELQEQQLVPVVGTDMTTGKTSKPKRLNDDELEKLMENAGKFVSTELDDAALEQIKARGIGTPATRTNIVQKLVGQEYIEIKKNLVYLTEKGHSFMQLVYDQPIASVELTGEFEMRLADVENGRVSAQVVMDEFKNLASELLEHQQPIIDKIQALSNSGQMLSNINRVGTCPTCGEAVIENDKMYSCVGRSKGCNTTIWKTFRNVKITAKQAEQLLSGKEVLMKGFTVKDQPEKTYDLYISFVNQQIATRYPTVEDKSLGKCPCCGSPVIEGSKAYGCSAWKSGCAFRIWKTVRNVELDVKAARALLAGKRVEIEFTNEKGSYTQLAYLDDAGVLQLSFETMEDKSLGSCPVCGKPIIENERFYGCSGWKDGCKVRMAKEFLGKKITPAQIKKLLSNGKTDKIKDLQGKEKTFDAALQYDVASNRYSFYKEKAPVCNSQEVPLRNTFKRI